MDAGLGIVGLSQSALNVRLELAHACGRARQSGGNGREMAVRRTSSARNARYGTIRYL